MTNQGTTSSNPNAAPRDQLRKALAERQTAYDARKSARAALQRAETVLRAVGTEMERHRQAIDLAGQGRTKEVADAIKRGEQPAVTLNGAMTAAQHSFAEAQARYAVAKGARDQLANELAAVEQCTRNAEAIVSAAALAVVTAEAEGVAAELEPAFAKLLDISDHLIGLARLWSGGQ